MGATTIESRCAELQVIFQRPRQAGVRTLLCWQSSSSYDSHISSLSQQSLRRNGCCLQVSPRPFVEPPTCFKVSRIIIFFVALELLSFALFAELVNLLRLAQVLNEWFFMLVLELLDQPLDRALAWSFLLLDCSRRYSRYSVIHGVVTDFPVTFGIARWFPRWSCVLALWILLTILRVRF